MIAKFKGRVIIAVVALASLLLASFTPLLLELRKIRNYSPWYGG